MGHERSLAELEQLRGPPAGLWVLPGATSHRGGPCLAQARARPPTRASSCGKGRRGKDGGPGLHLPAGYSQAR